MFPELIEKLQHRVDLGVEEAAAAMDAIMDGQAPPAQVPRCGSGTARERL